MCVGFTERSCLISGTKLSGDPDGNACGTATVLDEELAEMEQDCVRKIVKTQIMSLSKNFMLILLLARPLAFAAHSASSVKAAQPDAK